MLKLTVFFLFLAIALVSPLEDEKEEDSHGGSPWGDGKTYANTFVNLTVSVPLPQKANYRRVTKDKMGKNMEHLYRVCNGKNKKTCGFWEDVKTKKKVKSGVTTYNKNKKELVIKKVQKVDEGTYYTGDKKKQFIVYVTEF